MLGGCGSARRLDKQPPRVPGPGLRDRADAGAGLADRVSRRHESEVAHSCSCLGDTARSRQDLGAQPDRGPAVVDHRAGSATGRSAPHASQAAVRRSRSSCSPVRASASIAPRASSIVACAAGHLSVTLASQSRCAGSTRSRRRTGCRAAAAASRAGDGRASGQHGRLAGADQNRAAPPSSSPEPESGCSLPASSAAPGARRRGRSVFTRSPDARGILLRAATTHSTPRFASSARQPSRSDRPHTRHAPAAATPRRNRGPPVRRPSRRPQFPGIRRQARRDDLRRVYDQADEVLAFDMAGSSNMQLWPPRGFEPPRQNAPHQQHGGRALSTRQADGRQSILSSLEPGNGRPTPRSRSGDSRVPIGPEHYLGRTPGFDEPLFITPATKNWA